MDVIDDAMLEARFLQVPTRPRHPPTVANVIAPAPAPPLIAKLTPAPSTTTKGHTAQQLDWLDPAKRLPLGDAGRSARAYLQSINACFSCRVVGHHRLICPTRPPSTPPNASASVPVANLVSLADDDEPDHHGVFAVDPVTDTLVQDASSALAGSVPLIMVNCRFKADGNTVPALVDCGAGINVVDRAYAEQQGWQGRPIIPVGTKMADNRAGPVVDQEYVVDVIIGDTTYNATPFYAMALGPRYRLILGLQFCRQHRLFDGAEHLNHLLNAGGSSYTSLVQLQLNSITPVESPTVSTERHSHSDAILREFADILPANISDVSHYPPICSSTSQKENGKFRFLCDFRGLNSVTVKDRTPVPNIDDILQRAARGKVFAKLDLTDAFFQTLMHEPDIEKTAISTPWGLYEWVVMPQGACNSPATQQRRLNEALRNLISVCCEAYVDDIIIWGATDSDLAKNIRAVLTALRNSGFVCSPSKSKFFVDSVSFLGHVISPNHIGPDPKKVEALRAWPSPGCVKDLRSFLGLLQYLRKFIPHIATKTSVLTALLPPNKTAEKAYESRKRQLAKGLPAERLESLSWLWKWTTSAQDAFEALKEMVARITGLSPLSHEAILAGQTNLYLFTDASNTGLGAWLGTGLSPDDAQPIAYDSRSLTAAERNYPVHEKELCAIIHALKEWRPLLLGVPVHVMTDHATLKWFFQQPNLSERQKRWLLVLADYDLQISHIPGATNVIADAFSRLRNSDAHVNALTMMVLSPNATFLDEVADGYGQDPVMSIWREVDRCPPGVRTTEVNGARGYFWDGMASDVKDFVSTCPACQTSKATTTKPPGLLHSLPVPPAKFSDIGIDFVGPLPQSHSFDYLIVITDRLTGWVALIPTVTTLTSSAFAQLYYDHWLKMSTAYHPQTDGISERSNKTVIQILRTWTDDQGRNWAANLQRVAFAMNNTIRRSTHHTPAELVFGKRLSLTPPLLPSTSATDQSLAQPTASEWDLAAQRMALEEGIARDELLLAKHRQSVQANKHRRPDPVYRPGDKVYLNTAEFRHEYKTATNRSAKFMPRWEGVSAEPLPPLILTIW
ncbi:hypothetical protein CNBN2070 [Cryptococcus deneoformans B-3501A]|uniref:hypothetical protein n=1 Tax=Cryptococcus deneoformans (strain B-3501A) TaxID=283643 RepID=UPI000042C691|nr:hypothetical protein CNBN2070 [Cryptococcus neoformans var. neoformans B-3501A]EAL17161.1 hypothetical protein CNBN2070 [Cryptococcus neoformans var. neoformans B-3501A]